MGKKRRRFECQHCKLFFAYTGIRRHAESCPRNPLNKTVCICCGNPFYIARGRQKKQITCSLSCANTYFRSGVNNGNWTGADYRAVCFTHHGCKCLCCDEDKVVEAHHINKNRKDNKPENLVPLCPTHHRYMHTIYKKLILPQIEKYIKNWKDKLVKS